MPNVERRVSIAKTARSNIDTLAAVGVHSRWRGRGTRLATYYTCTCAGARCKKNRVKEKAGSGGRVSPSCSDRGRETNAAPVSVLVSRTPHPSVPAIQRVPQRCGTPHHAARCAVATVGAAVPGGRCQFVPRPVALPVYQPGALVKCFSSRIMTRSARL